MSFFPLFGGIVNSLITGFQNQNARDDYLQNEVWKAQYNSVPNQLDQWKRAGLNPQSFGGNFQPVTGTPPQPRSVGDSIASAFSQMGSLWQQKQLAKLNYDVEMSKLDLERQQLEIAKGDALMRKDLHNWNVKRAKQAFERGEYGLAMDILDYNYAFSTHDTRVKQLKDEAAITSEYAKRYPSYLSALINNTIERNLSLRHGRKLADQRFVFDWNKHYDDENYRYYSLGQSDQHFKQSFGLRESQFEETKGYHALYLDYLRERAAIAARQGDWQAFHRFQKALEQAAPVPRGYSSKIY